MHFNFDTLQFEEKEINAEKIAVAGSDKDITWKEFEEKVEQLCSIFKGLHIPKGHPICIYGHKEHLFPVVMLACIKSKLPYIPIDMVMPVERIRKIKKTSGSEILVCCGETKPDLDFEVIINNSLHPEVHQQPEFSECLWFENDPLVYIMFTSGSTGEPKGVMISYRAIKSFIGWLKRDFGLSSSDVYMNQASFSFDLSVYEIINTFINGATIVLNDADTTKNITHFISRIKKYHCSVWFSTPSFIYVCLSEPAFNSTNLPALSTILLIGETLPARTATKIHENFPKSILYNSYGPTEATVATTLIEITPDLAERYSSNLPVGYPKDDCKILIHNAENDPSSEGEIIIAGNHVSIGYLKNEALTAEKFFEHEGMRAYRTGDYGYLNDGVLFFNGRKDEQVKLNGFRIELGEINARLLAINVIDDAVTMPLSSGGKVKKIISFVKTKEDITMTNEQASALIISILGKSLPSYMIPSDFRFIKEFPVNSNHKTDKLKLLEWYME